MVGQDIPRSTFMFWMLLSFPVTRGTAIKVITKDSIFNDTSLALFMKKINVVEIAQYLHEII